jgi:hypothetical protein
MIEKNLNYREDHLDDYLKLSSEQILIWLEEANKFYQNFTTPEKLERLKEIKHRQFNLSSKPQMKSS